MTYLLEIFSHFLSYTNCCCNPVIYAFVSRSFRQDFKKAVFCTYISKVRKRGSKKFVVQLKHEALIILQFFSRYFAIVHALNSSSFRTRKVGNIGLCLIWVVAIGFAIPASLSKTYVSISINFIRLNINFLKLLL